MSAKKSVASDLEQQRKRQERIESLRKRLESVLQEMRDFEAANRKRLDSILPIWSFSARNLLHYLVLRRKDLRHVQEELAELGLSSLGRCEAFVVSNLNSVLRWLTREEPGVGRQPDLVEAPCDFSRGRELLRENTQRLFQSDSTEEPLIMVTMPSDAAVQPHLINDLVSAGMRVMRINCAHDQESTWLGMIKKLREAERVTGRHVRIMMDIAGPKIRTCCLQDGPKVIRIKPSRDVLGRVVQPGRLRLSLQSQKPQSSLDMPTIECHVSWCQSLQPGDQLRFKDTSNRKRQLSVTAVSANEIICETVKTIRISPNTVFKCFRKQSAQWKAIASGTLQDIPAIESRLIIRPRDLLHIYSGSPRPEKTLPEATQDDSPSLQIGCTLPEVFRDIKAGERVLLDDGKISGVVLESTEHELLVKITRARETGQRLGIDKGINFPDSSLRLPALTNKDVQDLRTVSEHADLVAYSFVRSEEDLQHLHTEMKRLGRENLGVVLKIENQQAFENLPLLLLEAMRHHLAFGVMIARGDLAVECGWERLVEIQEEVLWMCEAAHVPVIWATQVLEGLMQNGIPSRAEVTDAGLAARAECVMLNKGPYVVEAVRVLDDIMRRMKQHQIKKRATFRQLKVVERMWHE